MAVMFNSRLRKTTLGVLTPLAFALAAACGSDSGSGRDFSGEDAANNSKPADEDSGAGSGEGPSGETPSGDEDASTPEPSDAGEDASTEMGGGDAGMEDSGVGDAGGFVNDCEGEKDETPCGEDGLCFDEACVPSRCGDGVVDEALGEECEDDNDEGGDGCTLCRFDCSEDMDCDDENSCNGAETCVEHTCQPGTSEADGTACQTSDDMAGECRNQVCAPVDCGNEVVDDGEDCDDGNDDDSDGCTSKCTFTCATKADCDNGNACDGEETCNLKTHQCTEGKPIVCTSDSRSCVGVCQPRTGACEYPDLDMDGASCDTDCADADPAVFPGGFECKDGKDNDCNEKTTDADAPGCECYVDRDGDGFAASTTGSIAAAGACPDGYTRTRPTDQATRDCGPRVAAAYPGQREYFPTKYCPADGNRLCITAALSFDYDCNGKEESSSLDAKIAALSCAFASNLKTCIGYSGWVGKGVPACGVAGTYRSCSWSRTGNCTGTDTPKRVRPCH